MEINADFSQRAVVHGADLDWVPSPMAGVDRRMLDRIGGEVARATSIVRYQPGSAFSAHVHDGGEEFFVLDGVFQDEHGDYPAGSYVRNPPTSRHVPASAPGCTIFVKLWQFDLVDRTFTRIDTNKMAWLPDPQQQGAQVMPLFNDTTEDVRLERWDGGAAITLDAPAGAEVLTLDGTFTEAGETFLPQSWLRLPRNGVANLRAGPHGAQIWVKRGHLTETPTGPSV